MRCAGIEGTSSYGAGLARHLKAAGISVMEVERPKRRHLRRKGKSDPIDAEAAARVFFQSPKRSGRSRQGAPVRNFQMTASTNSRLPLSLLRPTWPGRPGSKCSIRANRSSLDAWRLEGGLHQEDSHESRFARLAHARRDTGGRGRRFSSNNSSMIIH